MVNASYIKLSLRIAHTVVDQLADLVGYPVNIMNSEGYVIASTDQSRVGSFHSGALTVVEQGLRELYIEKDEPLLGVKKGVNLPIILNDVIIGVVGITGEVQQVEHYGKIVKKMAEMLCADNFLQNEKELLLRIKKRFIEELFSITSVSYSPEIKDNGKQLGIDTDSINMIAALELKTPNQNTRQDQAFIDKLDKTLVSHVEQTRCGVVMMRNNYAYWLLYANTGNVVSEFITAFNKKIGESPEYVLKAGISNKFDRGNFKVGYMQARRALESVGQLNRSNCRCYNELGMEIFLHDITPQHKKEYLDKIFMQFSENELDTYTKILSAFYRNNGSITTTANELFIHKNTLQYKLNRLHEKTGYNPRSFEGAKMFMIAIDFFHLL